MREKQADIKWMQAALELAREAGARGEIPVGAVVVFNDQIIAAAGNLKEAARDPLGHAELIALAAAAKARGAWRLTGCTLYVTLEPCSMCAGAMIQSRIDRLVYGTRDTKTGAVHSIYELLSDSRLNHQAEVTEGVLAEESSALLRRFFSDLRLSKK